MSNSKEEKPAKTDQVLTKEHNLGIIIGLLCGFLISPMIRNAFKDSVGYWPSLFIAAVLFPIGAGVVTYILFTLLSRKSQS